MYDDIVSHWWYDRHPVRLVAKGAGKHGTKTQTSSHGLPAKAGMLIEFTNLRTAYNQNNINLAAQTVLGVRYPSQLHYICLIN